MIISLLRNVNTFRRSLDIPRKRSKVSALIIIDEPVGQYYGSLVAAPYAKQVFQGIIDIKGI